MTEKNELNQNIKLICIAIVVFKNDSRCFLFFLFFFWLANIFPFAPRVSDEAVSFSSESLKFIITTEQLDQASGCVNVWM